MSDQYPTDDELDGMARLEQTATAAPWSYRPLRFDDWGCIRAAPDDMPVASTYCLARDSHPEYANHAERYVGPPEVRANGLLVTEARNALRSFIAAARDRNRLAADNERLRIQLQSILAVRGGSKRMIVEQRPIKGTLRDNFFPPSGLDEIDGT